jgi:acyl-CoA synthetase (AMP-forming)/AMP-acid ligase II
VIELLERQAEKDPDRAAVLTQEGPVSYGRLLEDARAVAGGLAEHGIRRFAVANHDAHVVIAHLAGAALVGAEACLYPPVEAEEVAALLDRFDHEVLVTDRADLATLGVDLVPARRWFGGPPTEVTSEARPHLVLTTGTTGAPRGVRHDWRRLVLGVERVAPAGDQRWLLAFGLHQFAGLQVVLHVLAAGATLVAPAPRVPKEGLRAMRELGVTHASATPTYWRFLLAELRADGLPAPELQQVTLGGEAVPEPLLELLATTFPDARVSQVYAASEFGSTGSVRDGRAGLSTAVLERGDDAPVDLRVRDGELWVRSRTGMLGYYGEDPIDADGWRPTGDLVEVVGDRLEFRGRVSEIINVGGVKVHPLPIEERISAVDSVQVARVWGRPNPMTGAIVAVDVVATPGADAERVRDAIRAACEDLPRAAQPRSIRFVSEVATLGGKIIRRDDA